MTQPCTGAISTNETATLPGPGGGSPGCRLEAFHDAVRKALDQGRARESRQLLDEAAARDPSLARASDWVKLREVAAWPDAWLIAAVRVDPPDDLALGALVDRYWKGLFGRCRLLALNAQDASDLAQEAWCRILRARHALKPEGNFPAYIATIATNLWRDANRSARRAGSLGDRRISSLDTALPGENGETIRLADVVPDLKSLEEEKRRVLKLDIDQALERLTPRLREVLVARFIAGESCAEIGRRYGRTEQAVSGWVRQAIREMKNHLENPESGLSR